MMTVKNHHESLSGGRLVRPCGRNLKPQGRKGLWKGTASQAQKTLDSDQGMPSGMPKPDEIGPALASGGWYFYI
jgi:hypothetical protein